MSEKKLAYEVWLMLDGKRVNRLESDSGPFTAFSAAYQYVADHRSSTVAILRRGVVLTEVDATLADMEEGMFQGGWHPLQKLVYGRTDTIPPPKPTMEPYHTPVYVTVQSLQRVMDNHRVKTYSEVIHHAFRRRMRSLAKKPVEKRPRRNPV